jgi:hypothetical protein
LGSADADILIVADHASNRVPPGIDLGIDARHLEEHIAVDIGVAQVAEMLVEGGGFHAILANVSRLVIDLNREPESPGLVPLESDGIVIAGNGQPQSSCRLEVVDDKGTLLLTLRQPEGGFRRLVWPKGGDLAPADGAEPLQTKRLPGGGVEARIGGWTYHIEAKEGGLP